MQGLVSIVHTFFRVQLGGVRVRFRGCTQMDERNAGEFNHVCKAIHAFILKKTNQLLIFNLNLGNYTYLYIFLFQLSLLRYDVNGGVDQTSIIPLIDGGTEGLVLSIYVIFILFILVSKKQISFPYGINYNEN